MLFIKKGITFPETGCVSGLRLEGVKVKVAYTEF
jgi:hypothetical protein